MLEKWLEMDATASWGKLYAVIESPSVSMYTVPGKLCKYALCITIIVNTTRAHGAQILATELSN